MAAAVCHAGVRILNCEMFLFYKAIKGIGALHLGTLVKSVGEQFLKAMLMLYPSFNLYYLLEDL